MGTAEFFMLYLFVSFLMILIFGVGMLLGADLPDRFRKRVDAERILATHNSTVKRIDEVIDYYMGLQDYIANRLDGPKPGPRRSRVRSNANKEASQNSFGKTIGRWALCHSSQVIGVSKVLVRRIRSMRIDQDVDVAELH